jgi:hypothetical protein
VKKMNRMLKLSATVALSAVLLLGGVPFGAIKQVEHIAQHLNIYAGELGAFSIHHAEARRSGGRAGGGRTSGGMGGLRAAESRSTSPVSRPTTSTVTRAPAATVTRLTAPPVTRLTAPPVTRLTAPPVTRPPASTVTTNRPAGERTPPGALQHLGQHMGGQPLQVRLPGGQTIIAWGDVYGRTRTDGRMVVTEGRLERMDQNDADALRRLLPADRDGNLLVYQARGMQGVNVNWTPGRELGHTTVAGSGGFTAEQALQRGISLQLDGQRFDAMIADTLRNPGAWGFGGVATVDFTRITGPGPPSRPSQPVPPERPGRPVQPPDWSLRQIQPPPWWPPLPPPPEPEPEQPPAIRTILIW